MNQQRYPLEHLHRLAVDALCAHDVSAENAEMVADALVAAEADGLKVTDLLKEIGATFDAFTASEVTASEIVSITFTAFSSSSCSNLFRIFIPFIKIFK